MSSLACAGLAPLAAARAEGLNVEATPALGAGSTDMASIGGAEAAGGAGGQAAAPYWRVFASPYTYHWQYNPQHRPVYSIGVEWQQPDGWLIGGSSFRNSFGQPSAYLYGGKRFEGLLGEPRVFAEASAGLLYGYRGQFAKKVPFNHNGYSPGAVASLGWHFERHSEFSLVILGSSAVMFQFGWNFDPHP